MMVMVVVVVIGTEPVTVITAMAVFRIAVLSVGVEIVGATPLAASIAVEVGAEAETELVSVVQVVAVSAEEKEVMMDVP
jgi:hypothetical protein